MWRGMRRNNGKRGEEMERRRCGRCSTASDDGMALWTLGPWRAFVAPSRAGLVLAGGWAGGQRGCSDLIPPVVSPFASSTSMSYSYFGYLATSHCTIRRATQEVEMPNAGGVGVWYLPRTSFPTSLSCLLALIALLACIACLTIPYLIPPSLP